MLRWPDTLKQVFPLCLLALIMLPTTALAGAEWYGSIWHLPAHDYVSMRKGPSAKTKELLRLSGEEVTILGPCKNANTGETFVLNVDKPFAPQQAKIKQPGWFCAIAVWKSVGKMVNGFMSGKYLRLESGVPVQ